MPLLNLGILAHVDAGKTSLTERILFETGVIAAAGRVDKGNTQTDTLTLERERGITIQSAVVSFQPGDLKINLIDTPGHTDFIAEVERALHVLDAVIIVISAVEGVQSQTRKLVQAARAMELPILLAINKIDRIGTRVEPLLNDIEEKLGLRVVSLNTVINPGSRDVTVHPISLDDSGVVNRLVNLLAEQSDQLIAAYVEADGQLPPGTIETELRTQIAAGHVVPAYFASALLGIGVDAVLDGVARWLPTPTPQCDAPTSGEIFKIQRDPDGEKLAYLRLRTGRLANRQRLTFHRRQPSGELTTYEAKITGIERFHDGKTTAVAEVGAGEIVRVHGLKDTRIGDTSGGEPRGMGDHRFALPPLESIVRVNDPTQVDRLYQALERLAEQDPFINIRRHAIDRTISVRLYGEVQKEVIGSTLERDFGLNVTFEASQIVCIERPVGTGAAVEFMGDHPFAATVGIRIEPAPPFSGITYHRELGSLPPSFYTAIEETVLDTMQEGLCGWQVDDCVITLTHVGYSSPVTIAADFRKLTPLVVMAALKEAGTVVLEPIQRFELDVPEEMAGGVLATLIAARAVPEETASLGPVCRISGTIPAAELHEFEQRLPGLSKGEGLLSAEFADYQPIPDPPSIRPRTDFNPLNRKEYLARVSQG